MKVLIFMMLAAAVSFSAAHADELEDAYKAGFSAGYAKGYAEGHGTSTAISVAGKGIIIPGTNFETIIDSDAASSTVTVSPDSSVAIIPDRALGEIRQRLGADFLRENGIQLNNSLEP